MITVFTKPWYDPLDILAQKIAALGVDGVELPIRPGYQVEPETAVAELPRAVKILADHGLAIRSIAGPYNERTIAVCAENSIPVIRIFAPIDPEIGFYKSLERYRREFDAAVPWLDRYGVCIGIQPHAGPCIGSAAGLLHLVDRYDPRHIAIVPDMAHCAVAGEPSDLALDIAWPRMCGLVNFKATFQERINGPEEIEARFRVRYTTARNSAYSWSGLIDLLNARGFDGDYCLTGQYSDPAGGPQLMGDCVNAYLLEDIAYLKSLLAKSSEGDRT
ncbi:sugar phosphate isomerase/epimerase family protein [Agrobacterium tumefaciens]|uniref:sugar phosphate isomerase/epimerase family protein n=1 Tax=Agrobacterium tumefaciens TaxID=358 RepID=UPI001885C9EA|nr:TIM barrel protein [Agrobacterium tumefaciens]